MLLFFPDSAFEMVNGEISFRIGMIPLAVMGLGAGAFVPSALAMMADSSESKSYGATMGLYSFALGFGAFIAEGLGLIIIKLTGEHNAPGWILYFAAALVGLAVVMMVLFFFVSFVKSRLKGRRAGSE
jgi:MFS family permease